MYTERPFKFLSFLSAACRSRFRPSSTLFFSSMTAIGVIGGGITGLTAAYRLQAQGCEVRVFEREDRPGGKMKTDRRGGYLVEHGPNTLQPTAPIETLIDDLGLREARVEASPAARKRYVVRAGRPVALPTSPARFLRTELFSSRAKLRLLAEPFVRAANGDQEESVADFVRRRLGAGLLDYGLNPFVAGIFAGDPERLAVRHAFPRLHELEQNYGSLTVGRVWEALRRARPKPARRRMFSFRNGMNTLPEALTRSLGNAVACGTTVTSIHRSAERWTVATRRTDGASGLHRFDAILYTAPLHALKALDFDTGFDLTPLAQVPHPPVSVVALGFPSEQVTHPLDGFGLLVPEVEQDIRILGTFFSSTLFPGRAPAGHVLLTTFVGGMRRPELGRSSPDTLYEVVRRDLGRLLGVQGRPSFAHHICWKRAIPQYHLGYGAIKDAVRRLELRHPGFFMAGNYRRGISVGDAIASADAAAARIAEWLGHRA